MQQGSIAIVLACSFVANSKSYEPYNEFESNLLKIGKQLSLKHSHAFNDMFHSHFFKVKSGKSNHLSRKKRAFWGLDKFFNDAQKAKDHFGGLTDRIGHVFQDEEDQV